MCWVLAPNCNKVHKLMDTSDWKPGINGMPHSHWVETPTIDEVAIRQATFAIERQGQEARRIAGKCSCPLAFGKRDRACPEHGWE